jgi:hypothetical protein
VRAGDVFGGWEVLSARPAYRKMEHAYYRMRCRTCRRTTACKRLSNAKQSVHCALCRQANPEKAVVGRRYGGWRLVQREHLRISRTGRRVFRFRCARCEQTISEQTMSAVVASFGCVRCSAQARQRRPTRKKYGGFDIVSVVPVGRAKGGRAFAYRMECRRCGHKVRRSLGAAEKSSSCARCVQIWKAPAKLNGRVGQFTLMSTKPQDRQRGVVRWLWKCDEGHVAVRATAEAKRRQCIECFRRHTAASLPTHVRYGIWQRVDSTLQGRDRGGSALYLWECVVCDNRRAMPVGTVRRIAARKSGKHCYNCRTTYKILGRRLTASDVAHLFPGVTKNMFIGRVRRGLTAAQAALLPRQRRQVAAAETKEKRS